MVKITCMYVSLVFGACHVIPQGCCYRTGGASILSVGLSMTTSFLEPVPVLDYYCCPVMFMLAGTAIVSTSRFICGPYV